MKAVAWSPASFLDVIAVEREAARWLVAMCSRQRAYCPVCGVQSRSRHSFTHARLATSPLRGRPLRSGCVWVAGAAGTSGAIAGFSPNVFQQLPPPRCVRPTAWRRSSGCAVIARAARPSARLMARLGMRVSDTILRRLKQYAGTRLKRAAVRVAGIDGPGALPCGGSANRSRGRQNGNLAQATS
jgi:hypothetical protein